MKKTNEVPQNVRIFEYVRDHPQCSVRAIREYFGFLNSTVGTVLRRLESDGLIQRIKGKNQEPDLWSAVENAIPRGEQPRRVFRDEWKPHNRRDELVEALFGRAA